MSFEFGLIVNELLINAYEYAFPDGGSGVIRIILEEQSPGEILLTIRDNGIGIPEETLHGTSYSSGLMLVQELAKQYHGHLRVENDGGALVEVLLTVSQGSSHGSANGGIGDAEEPAFE